MWANLAFGRKYREKEGKICIFRQENMGEGEKCAFGGKKYPKTLEKNFHLRYNILNIVKKHRKGEKYV